jgi:hypothetical protein
VLGKVQRNNFTHYKAPTLENFKLPLAVPNTIKCLRTRENILLKMEKLLLIWISAQQAKGYVNSKLIR